MAVVELSQALPEVFKNSKHNPLLTREQPPGTPVLRCNECGIDAGFYCRKTGEFMSCGEVLEEGGGDGSG